MLRKRDVLPYARKEFLQWRYLEMSFVAVESIQDEPYASRVYDVVAAGNIWNFFMFHVVLVKDIPERDALLEKIHTIAEGNISYTRPSCISKESLVMFLNKMLPYPMWRRGLVIKDNFEDHSYTAEVLDIDTGEININVPVISLRNLTSELFHLPVFSIPVRFSVRAEERKYFIENSEGNCVLGKYLHMILRDPNKGLLLQFHRWDSEYPSYTPGGVCVVSGFLIDIITKKSFLPQVCISSYLLEKFKNRKPDEVLPEWPERIPAEEEDDWSIELMRRRHPYITYMINYYKGLGAEHMNDPNLIKTKPVIHELKVEQNRENQPYESIFRDKECADSDPSQERLRVWLDSM